MRRETRRGLKTAMVVGMVAMMTGCSPADPALTGDSLYRDGEKRYIAYSTVMHDVIMAVHEGDWSVDTWGAAPISCKLDDGQRGYTFSWVREHKADDIDVDAVVQAARSAFTASGVDVNVAEYGEGDSAEINVIGTGDRLGRGVVTIRPGRGVIRATANPGCFPGDAGDLSDMVFDGLVYDSAWQRFPAFEGPDWQPRFYFPEDGSPVYREADGSPVQPQPSPDDLPVAPYGEGDAD
ncbi:hypothetical protein AB0N59_02260 [Microbacterium sp. NPDC089321]|uniref:hypothetical protein n=1 Tax=Microbacterium sp. NPDC089321 TaxID=3155183 RepID=UPI00341D6F92